MRILVAVICAALGAALAATAAAHVALSPCCEEHPCPEDRPVSIKGLSPEDALCCEDRTLRNCENVPNAGYWCTQSPILPTIFLPQSGGTGGCVELGSELCAAAAAFVDGRAPGGCVGLGYDNWFYDGAIRSDAAGCTKAAVAACCAAGACE